MRFVQQERNARSRADLAAGRMIVLLAIRGERDPIVCEGFSAFLNDMVPIDFIAELGPVCPGGGGREVRQWALSGAMARCSAIRAFLYVSISSESPLRTPIVGVAPPHPATLLHATECMFQFSGLVIH